jgi:hypothetical protein
LRIGPVSGVLVVLSVSQAGALTVVSVLLILAVGCVLLDFFRPRLRAGSQG